MKTKMIKVPEMERDTWIEVPEHFNEARCKKAVNDFRLKVTNYAAWKAAKLEGRQP